MMGSFSLLAFALVAGLSLGEDALEHMWFASAEQVVLLGFLETMGKVSQLLSRSAAPILNFLPDVMLSTKNLFGQYCSGSR